MNQRAATVVDHHIFQDHLERLSKVNGKLYYLSESHIKLFKRELELRHIDLPLIVDI